MPHPARLTEPCPGCLPIDRHWQSRRKACRWWRWRRSLGILGGCGLLALAALAGTPLSRRPWRWLGVAAAVAAAAMAITGVWINWSRGGEPLAYVTSLAAVLGYWNLALLVPLSQRWVRRGSPLSKTRCLQASGPSHGHGVRRRTRAHFWFWRQTCQSMGGSDRRVGPADQGAFNLDFVQWLGGFNRQKQGIIEHLAAGKKTNRNGAPR